MLERLSQLEKNVVELEKYRKEYKLSEIKNNLQLQWILRYGLFESIQIVIDVACHLVTKYNLGNPKTYGECIKILQQEEYLQSAIAEKLLGMVGLRNILIHEYVEVSIEKLVGLLDNLNDFKTFAEEVKSVV
jgi:uncharacterized protein YutE (UPF0331/DUF86 family)